MGARISLLAETDKSGTGSTGRLSPCFLPHAAHTWLALGGLSRAIPVQGHYDESPLHDALFSSRFVLVRRLCAAFAVRRVFWKADAVTQEEVE